MSTLPPTGKISADSHACDTVGTFQRPRSDSVPPWNSAPGELCPLSPLVTPLMQLTYSCKNKVGTWLASENADVSLSFRQIPIKIVESGNAAVCF